MRMSLYAIEKVMRYSKVAQEQLESNLKWVKGSVIGEASQIKEKAAEKCLEEIEYFHQNVIDVAKDLEHIHQLMIAHKQFIEDMNS